MPSFNAIPYCGVAPLPEGWLARWNLDPWLLAALAGVLLLALTRPAGRERGLAVAAVAVLAVAFVSPLCALSSALFSARTLHHLLLIAVAAPLVAWATPPLARARLPLATATQLLVLFAWHLPAAYQAALSDTAVYWAMQASLIASAVWFWRAARAASPPGAVAGALAAMIGMGLLGAVLTFAPTALYGPHLLTTAAWGLKPLVDQQAAGLLMWAPGSAVYLAFALARIGQVLGPSRAIAA